MLGAAGALCCVAAGAAIGSWLKERRIARLRMLRAWTESIGLMRILLEQERPPLTELLGRCVRSGTECDEVTRRIMAAAEGLAREPLAGVGHAYAAACARVPMPWEQAEERVALERLFTQLGSGPAAMRLQAAVNCLHRLRPLLDTAQAEAERSGRLCMQLGLLIGLMAGIVLW